MLLRFTEKLLLAAALSLVASSSLAQERVSIAWTPSADIPQIAQAIDKKLWAEQGLEVRVVTFPTGREALEALIGGQVDFASMAELPAVTAALRQQKFAVLARLSKYRANRIIANGIDLKSTRDLAGRKIALTVGTNSHFALDWELDAAGVKAEVVNVAPPDIVPALSRGDVEAAVMFPSFFDQAKRVLGEKYRELITPGYVTNMLLAGTADVIEKRPEQMKKLMAGLLKADALVAQDPAGTQDTIARVVGKVINADAVRAAWPDYEYKVALDKDLLTLMVREGQWIVKRGSVKNVEATEQLFRSYLNDSALKTLAADRVQLQ
jgi:ABC-type nitrate/sulfonate/bicarbonate transport system substrate-binding protein